MQPFSVYFRVFPWRFPEDRPAKRHKSDTIGKPTLLTGIMYAPPEAR